VRRRTEVLEQRNKELHDALEKLRRAQDDLIRTEKLASMGRLVAGIAHEINNPVNAVINTLGPLEGALQALAGAKDPAAAKAAAAEAQEMLSVVQRGAARSKAIVQALHNYSRGDEEKPRELALARSIDDTLDLLRHRLQNVRVEKKIDPTIRLMGFAGQIAIGWVALLTIGAYTTAVLTAGHTPGHQSFVVDLAGGGGFVFAFDAACTVDGCDREVPGGLIDVTLEHGAAQIRRLKRLAAERGYQLIPGHDPVAWPALTAALTG